jgi:hypothetical protein
MIHAETPEPAHADTPATTEPRKRRRRACTVEIPAEIHALSVLTGRDPEQIVDGILSSYIASIRKAAPTLPLFGNN